MDIWLGFVAVFFVLITTIVSAVIFKYKLNKGDFIFYDNSINDVIVLFDVSGKIIKSNDEFNRLMLTSKTNVYLSFLSFLLKKVSTKEELPLLLEASVKSGSWEFDHTVKAADQQNLSFSIRIIKISSFFRKRYMLRAQPVAAVNKSNQSADSNIFSELFNQSNEGYLLFDPMTLIISMVSDKFSEFLGYKSNEMLGKMYTEIIPEGYERLFQNIDTLLSSQNVLEFERNFVHKNGQIRTIYINASVVNVTKRMLVLIKAIDISEKQKILNVLTGNGDINRLLIEESPVGIAVTNSDGKIIDVNTAMLNMLGSTDKLKTLSFNVLTMQSMVDSGVSEVFKDVLTRREKYAGVKKYTSYWGKVSFFKFQIVPLFTESNQLIGSLSIVEDLTESMEAQERLNQSEELFRSMIQTIPFPIFIVNMPETKIKYVNQSLLDLFGYSEEEIIGQLGSVLYYHPADRGKIAHELTVHGFAKDVIVDGRKSNGELITFSVFAHLISYFGENAAIVICVDLRERLAAERALSNSQQQYIKLFDNMYEGVYQIDEFGSFITVNQKLVNMLGYGSKEELTSLNFYKSIICDKEGLNKLRANNHLTADELIFHDIDCYKKDGSVVTLSINQRACNGNQSPKIFDATVIDITTYKKIERAKERLEEQLIHAQRIDSLGTLAGGIAHDFNNVLSMITIASEQLQLQLSDLALKKYVDMISSSAERGGAIAKQLLIFSRNEKIEMQTISLTKSINEIVELVRHTFPKSIKVSTFFNAKNGLIRGNSAHLNQVLMNLCINAKDAILSSGKLQGEIAIETKNVNPGQDLIPLNSQSSSSEYVCLALHDNGTGMSEEVLKKVFEPFYTTKPRGKGTGLGLSIVNSIMDAHNGFMKVDSTPGHGTTFSLFFPAVAQVAETETYEIIKDISRPRGAILIVDDEDVLRNSLKNILDYAGYTVLEAHDGHQALELYRRKKDDILYIITDLGMPNMDGLELLTEIRKISNHVKVLIATGYLDDLSHQDLVRKGASKVILKPYKVKDLMSAISDL